MPSGVQTGSWNGWRLRLQQWNGSFATGRIDGSFLPPHSSLCSVTVMYSLSFECLFFPIFFPTFLELDYWNFSVNYLNHISP